MKVLKWIIIILLSLGLIGYVAYLIVDEDLPTGEEGPKAEELANRMLEAVNDSAWHAIEVVEWNFTGQRHLVWDKVNHRAKVSWDNYDVFIKLGTKEGVAFAKEKKIEREEVSNKLLDEAYGIWANDSFWLNPITKIKDNGTIRKYVTQTDENKEGLLVTYQTGGVTPGDSYLWVVDKKTALAEYVKMWVQIIPIGGMKFTWDDWNTTPEGAKIATSHESVMTINISELNTWPSLNMYPNLKEFEVLN